MFANFCEARTDRQIGQKNGDKNSSVSKFDLNKLEDQFISQYLKVTHFDRTKIKSKLNIGFVQMKF